MTDADLVHVARAILTDKELAVWLAKHVSGKGRRAGSLALGITEDAWRYRIQQADRKMMKHRQEAA